MKIDVRRDFNDETIEISWILLQKQLDGLKELMVSEVGAPERLFPFLVVVQGYTDKISDLLEGESSLVQIMTATVLLEAALHLQADRLRDAAQCGSAK